MIFQTHKFEMLLAGAVFSNPYFAFEKNKKDEFIFKEN